jgi:hypothetical protein
MQSEKRFPRSLGRGEVVRGEPYDVGGRTLTPLARIRSFGAAGRRFEIVAVEPIGIVEETGGSRRLLAIGSGRVRRAAMLALIGLPVLAFVVASAIARAYRRSRRRGRFARRGGPEWTRILSIGS